MSPLYHCRLPIRMGAVRLHLHLPHVLAQKAEEPGYNRSRGYVRSIGTRDGGRYLIPGCRAVFLGGAKKKVRTLPQMNDGRAASRCERFPLRTKRLDLRVASLAGTTVYDKDRKIWPTSTGDGLMAIRG
jgi:hypothetical protein